MTPQEADKVQHWAGMDGATAFQLIERRADGWADIREMMDAWLRANQGPGEPVGTLTVQGYRATIYENIDFNYYGNLKDGTYKLYTSAPTIQAALDEFLQKREQDSFSCKQLVSDLRDLLAAAPK